MSTELIDSLLADIPTEEVKDDRLGVHDEAHLTSPLTVAANEWQGKMIYSLRGELHIKDVNGEDSKVSLNISVPDSEAPKGFKQVLLQWLQGFGIVPPLSKNAPVIPAALDEESKRAFVEKIAAAINTRVGEPVSVTVYEQRNGFTGVRANRPKVQKS